MGALLNSRESRISVELYMNDDNAKAYFGLLSEQREMIEQELGFSLEWMELPDRKSSRLVVHANDRDPTAKSAWPEYHQWMMEKLEKIDSVFRSRIKDLDANAWQPDHISEHS